MHVIDTPQFPMRALQPNLIPLPFNFTTDGAGDIVQASSLFPPQCSGARNGTGIYEVTIPNNWKLFAAIAQYGSTADQVVVSQPANTTVRFTFGSTPANLVSKRVDGVIWVLGAQV